MSQNKYGHDILNPKTYDEMSKMVREAATKPSLDDLAKMVGINVGDIAGKADKFSRNDHRWEAGGPAVIITEQDLKEDLQKCKESFRAVAAQKALIEKALDFISNLPFKAGDAAFHRTFGNVLVQGILLNSGDYTNSSYCILLTSGKRGQSPLNELLPISEATKVLYGKG